MRDVELYRALLGLTAPWTVAGVDVDMARLRVMVRVDAGAGPYPCPECGAPGPRHDSKPRPWRYLDTMQFKTPGDLDLRLGRVATDQLVDSPCIDRGSEPRTPSASGTSPPSPTSTPIRAGPPDSRSRPSVSP